METNRRSRPEALRRILGVAAAAVTLMLVVAGCGSNMATDDASATNLEPTVAEQSADSPTQSPITSVPELTSPTDGPTSTARHNPTSSTSVPPSGANAITITTPGMEFDVAGTLRPGVATITLNNTDDEAHMMVMSRLKDGVTLDQITTALAKSEDDATALLLDGPETTYGTPAPVGAGQSTTVTALDLPAGHYVLVCFFAGKDGLPHFAMGMIGETIVTGDTATEKPSSDGTITLGDDGAELPANFTGNGTFLVINAGSTLHSLSFAALDPGTTLPDYFGHVGQAQQMNMPVDGGGGTLAGGVDELMPGQSAYLTIDLKPGHYGYLSPADANGPHLPAIHGEFDIN